MPPLETFPLLSPAEFKTICHGFVALQQNLLSTSQSLKQQIWSLKEKKLPWGQDSVIYLSLSKLARHWPAGRPSEAESEVEGEGEGEGEAEHDITEDDPESLPPLRRLPNDPILIAVEYNILYSPTFRVPVLWFSQPPQGVVAVEGKLTLGDHPVTGEISWFVHPCQTREAMEVWRGTEVETDTEWGRYLAVWLELVGRAAGLDGRGVGGKE
ncbi:hypothetical protein FPQ18DRAFT_357625 [Pyronema domesticum]|uniref:Ubiquitin-like-conjugating enzyme ATG10 n=1 Tax=Pyronema omphalodes (strain CBS 100304) TaxID=1076935 RepID=U4LCQ2_PYROM|nr:hypothetical protein FPQ18DRAFT_357625 [Pyronema domesticum]CCX12198.1 Similar to Uncharacterized protein C227.04; acc. no. Q9UTD5 [Pyronema omphalodes CBS 100304]